MKNDSSKKQNFAYTYNDTSETDLEYPIDLEYNNKRDRFVIAFVSHRY